MIMVSWLRSAIFQAMVGKVCVIGAGPSGLGILCWFAKQKREGKVVIIITIIIIIIINDNNIMVVIIIIIIIVVTVIVIMIT